MEIEKKDPKKSLGEMTFEEVMDFIGFPAVAVISFKSDIEPVLEKYKFTDEEKSQVINLCIQFLCKKLKLRGGTRA